MLDHLFSLKGKVALVTGGGTGIGRMATEALLGAGAERVYIASRKLEVIEQTAAELDDAGRCIAIQANLSSVDGCRQLADALMEREECLDIAVNNSGNGWAAPFDTFPEAGWDRVFQLNLKAPFFLTQALLPLLERAATKDCPARVINVGSIAGQLSNGHDTFPYGLSKGALHHATQMLALELGKRSITVNAISPGRFATSISKHITNDPDRHERELEIIPLGRWGIKDDLAGIIILLASRAGAYMTGDVITVDGGTLLHHSLDL